MSRPRQASGWLESPDAAASPGAGAGPTAQGARPQGRRRSRAGSARPRPAARRLKVWALVAVAATALFAAYYRSSLTEPVNSDGASNALQAWDILHGNVLLHGWWLTDVSFYTTELPQYMMVELVHGLNADVVHLAAAMTYTLLVLLTALLARGDAIGRQAAVRMTLAVMIVLAPQLGFGAYVLLLSPDHVGTSVCMLAILLVLDRFGQRRWAPAVVGLLLAWVLVADAIVLYIGVLPLVLVAAARAYQAVVVRRERPSAVRSELALGGAALAAVALAAAAEAVIHALGGYYAWPASTSLVSVADAPHNLWLGLEGILLIFGADFSGMKLGLSAALVLLHLVGAGLAGWAVWTGARRLLREHNLVTATLTLAVFINVAAYLLSTSVRNVQTGREVAAVLPFGAALAGRLLADRVALAKLVPVLVAVLLGYVATLAHDTVQRAHPVMDAQLTSWLASHHLDYGLAGYWNASVVSLSSGNRVQVRPVCHGHAGFTSDRWEAKTSWYDPSLHRATFLVMDPKGNYGGVYSMSKSAGSFTNCSPPNYAQVEAAFGRAQQEYRVGRFTILVWDENLLTKLAKR